MRPDRSVQNQAMGNSRSATGTASGYGSTAGGIGATLVPGMTQQYTNPQGLGQVGLNAELGAAEQAGGGATGAVQGEAGLNAMRTRNTGALSSVLDQAARRGGQNLSQSALGIQAQNEQLKQKQREEAAQGLQGLYGTDVGAQLKSMGIADEDLNTALAAGRQGWLQNTMGVVGTLGGMGLGAAKAAGFG